MSVRLTEEDERRLEETAKLVRLSKHGLAELAIRAAVEAIEANGGKIVLPLEFTTTHAAVVKPLAPPVKTEQTLYAFPSDQGFKAAETTSPVASAS
jgi:hypothetical protein